VPAGGARRGRRDNGLSAAEYAAVGDVDPRVGEHLLDVLAGAGIAAYLQPATDLHPVTRTTTLPARPTDRLFADRDHLDTAKDLLARLRADERGPDAAASGPRAAAPEPFDVEAAWAGIVAGFNERVDSTTAHWPAAEDVADDDGTDEEPADLQRVIRYAADESPPSLLDALDTFGADLPDEDEGYTPPPPPPLPRPSRPALVAILAIVGGLVIFFAPGVLPISSNLALLLGFGALLTGVVTLIWRLRSGDDEDEDPDDGAVV
jgi:hypothetical protein